MTNDTQPIFTAESDTTTLVLEPYVEVVMEDEDLTSGAIPYVIGQPTLIRIPIPGTNNLCIEFRPRGHVPSGGSTSTLFFQDITGRRHLRLDYGYNNQSNTIDYHWNQKGTFDKFRIKDHTTISNNGKFAYRLAKFFKYAGRTLFVVGAGLDTLSIAQASNPIKRATEVISAWALAWAGCKVGGALGSGVGTVGGPWGIAGGGIIGCIIGGAGGYFVGDKVGGVVYDWVDGTQFTTLMELSNDE